MTVKQKLRIEDGSRTVNLASSVCLLKQLNIEETYKYNFNCKMNTVNANLLAGVESQVKQDYMNPPTFKIQSVCSLAMNQLLNTFKSKPIIDNN